MKRSATMLLIARVLALGAALFWLAGSATLVATQQTPAPTGFRILLFKASYGPGPKPDGLTGGSAKAFDDVVTMLPFNSYQRIDSATVPAEGGTTKIAGPYDATLTVSPVEDKFAVGLSLKEKRGAHDPNKRPQNARTLPDSSFVMSLNETAAESSSRTDEGAILVLSTALRERLDAGQSNAAEPTARPLYLAMIDFDVLSADDIRHACIASAAFVDGLDPDDRVAILDYFHGHTPEHELAALREAARK